MIKLDILAAVGILITLIKSFFSICIGRLIYGFAAGAFSVICPMFISEISPVSISGPLGVISEFNITLGAFLSFIVGYIYIPYSGTPEEFESGSWRVVFGFPLIIIFIHLILIGCVFTYDSPKFYATRKQKVKIKEFEARIYDDPLDGEDSEELIEEPE